MVPGRPAQPRLAALALPLPPAGLPLRRPGGREPPPGQGRPGVRAAGHRRLRPGLLGGGGHLRQGRAGRPGAARHGEERRAGARPPARPAHPLVPQHLVLGAGRAAPGAAPGGRRHRGRPRDAGRRTAWRPAPGPGGVRPGAPVLRQRDQRPPRSSARTRRRRRPTPRTASTTTCVSGAPTVNPAQRGTKAAWWYTADVAPGATVEFRLRLHAAGAPARPDADAAPEAILDALGPGWAGEASDALLREREAEADAFYATLTPADATPEEARVLRQAFAGMLWSKQYYAYDVKRWLDGDPGQPPPPAQRRRGRNAAWGHLDAADVFSMPDPWEYPWFAAWDLAFHAVTLAYVDPTFAKYQLIAVCREWFMHPNGALPAYEWAFDDVNPPVHAWAAAMVYLIDGAARPGLPGPRVPEAAAELHLVGQPQGRRGQQPLRGGLPGPGQHRPLRPLAPPGGRACWSSPTARPGWPSTAWPWGGSPLELARDDRAYEGLVTKFLEHFAEISEAMNRSGLWDEQDGFFYDRLVGAGRASPIELRYRSIVGVIPALAALVVDGQSLRRARRGRVPQALRRLRRAPPRPAHDGAFELGQVPRHARTATGCSSRWSARSTCGACWRRCSTRSPCSRPTGCARSPSATGSTPSPSGWATSAPPSTTSRRSPAPASSGATPTGGAPCGSPSTTWWSRPWSATTTSWATPSPWSAPPARAGC